MWIRSLAVLLALSLSHTTFAASSRPFPVTVHSDDIQAKYASEEPIRILIVPGHEPGYGGAEYRTIKERDVAVEIANELATTLRANKNLTVHVSRDTLAWSPELTKYFKHEWKDIATFVQEKKKITEKLVKRGKLADRSFEVSHNTATEDVALRLYGMTRFANENEYDLAIHLHLNDNLGHGLSSPGFHSGFAVYVPDEQYGNAEASHELGTAVASQLNHFSATSTLPIENYGVVPDQDLIALGSFNTAEFASILIEYAYVYESKIVNAEARSAVIADFAHQTSRGIETYLGERVTGSDTRVLPYAWRISPLPAGSANTQVYALQVALHKLGFYPPTGELLIGCPISGYVGECTTRALKAFQASRGLEQTGTIGPRTKAALESLGY